LDDFFQKIGSLLNDVTPQIDNENDFRVSAVIVPLVIDKDQIGVLFEVRSDGLNWQPGDVCFPGGRIELDDPDPLSAALRETEEELGIDKSEIKVLGPLNYLVSPIGVMLYPYVACLPAVETLKPNPAEVADTFVVPLEYLLSVEPLTAHMELATRPLPDFPLEMVPPTYVRDWKRRTAYPVLFYQYDGHVIWGLTARVLAGFLESCRNMDK
jgi:8-oxo-dGTP pyrophosphatase MutT (NUDIX family)